MTRPDAEVVWALRILLGVLVFLGLIWVLGGAREAAGLELATPDPECLDPPPQWQPGEPPWDGSDYGLRFCVPHLDVTGGPIYLGQILGCGLGVGRNTLPGHVAWIFSAWKLALEPGEKVVHYWPEGAPEVLRGVHETVVVCVRRGRTPSEALVSAERVTPFVFPGPPEPPDLIRVPSLRQAWAIILAAILGVSGAILARRRAWEV